MTSASMSVM